MMTTYKTITLLILSATGLAMAGTGCNTSKGLGKDVEKLGDKIQEKASR